mmetsp:Transcript_8120/g.18517  ORF Transcript_8120/g.18517 Transcript_8120/m.18517 type:complete len:201 (-) Transcript_8120:161-763(-)
MGGYITDAKAATTLLRKSPLLLARDGGSGAGFGTEAQNRSARPPLPPAQERSTAVTAAAKAYLAGETGCEEAGSSELVDESLPPLAPVAWHRGDFLQPRVFARSWAGADLLMLCSTCFDQDTMDKAAKLAAEGTVADEGTAGSEGPGRVRGLAAGARVVTLDKPMPHPRFEVTAVAQCRGSWGTAVAFIQALKQEETPGL